MGQLGAGRRGVAMVFLLGTIGFSLPALADLAPPLRPHPKRPDPGPAQLTPGDYQCEFTQGEFKYPVFRCVIRKQMTAAGTAKFTLEKQGGSQRIKGSVEPTADGFRFEGQYFCPRGDCTEATQGDFKRVGRDKYQGSLKTSTGETKVKLYK
ncbi:MAG: hypothetical protein HY902_12135 [Deltaproteobacteria bacterium]|nr:hypothetical protein [Deltaproteobacteria bacterium]